MNKAQIKAELRRSACCDDNPYDEIEYDAFDAAYEWKTSEVEILGLMKDDDWRTFYLFVAEAM